MVKKSADRAGSFRKLAIAMQYCAHCLRTTFASICAENQIPLPVIQSWIGHSSPTVTRIYARIEDIRVKRLALEKFPEL